MARDPTVVSRSPSWASTPPPFADAGHWAAEDSFALRTHGLASWSCGRRALLVALDPSECWRLAASRSVTHPTRLETRTKESNMCASQWVSNKPRGAMKAKVGLDVDCVGIFPPSRGRRTNDPSCPIYRLGGAEHTRWDPKDGELCPGRTRPEETLVEVRSGSDVQIDRQIRV
ncbi:hypothetical protein CEXT_802831 [Caerostris extrusa]|uniref:Uncharacterized protein n=1 Tax=Caerostris extrusa TaxID=172846 RepID=A0AAV4M4U6_CAEEX|nr:hypothetical protein CEXT_802831 [Caerostris extrusa]